MEIEKSVCWLDIWNLKERGKREKKETREKKMFNKSYFLFGSRRFDLSPCSAPGSERSSRNST